VEDFEEDPTQAPSDVQTARITGISNRRPQGGGAASTKGRGPWKLIYYEAYLQKEDASGREVFLKSGAGRRFLDKQLREHFMRYPRRPAT
jgi:hypothetical protein